MTAEVAEETTTTNSSSLSITPAPRKPSKYAHLPQEKLFHLNDVDYTTPKEIPPNVVFTYLRDARRGGAEMAFANMFVTLCGEDALDALAEYDEMNKGEMKTLIKSLQSRVLGALEMGN